VAVRFALSLGAFIVVVGLYFLLVHTNPPKPPPAAVLARGGCADRTFPNLGGKHVSSGKPSAYRVRYSSAGSKEAHGATVVYNSFPPTSGPHYFVPAIWGEYSRPLVEIQAVHNLEHGGVIVQYGAGVPAATVARMRTWYASSPDGLLLAPLPRLGKRIALTAWTNRALCTRFDDRAFSDYRDAFRGRGPERFSVSSLKPGS